MELRLHTPRCRRSCRTSSSGPAAPSRACSQKRPLAKGNVHATLIATAGAAAGSTNLFFITLHTGQGRVRKKMQALYAFRLHLLWRVTAIRHRWCQDGHRCVKQTNNTSEQTSKQASKQTNKEQTNIQELPLVRVPSRAAIQNGKRVSTKVRGAAAWRSGRQHRLATMRITHQ